MMLNGSYRSLISAAIENLRCSSCFGMSSSCQGHGNAERKRALSYPYRKPGLDDRIIFVPDSKTVDGRRMIPMSDRAYEVLRARAAGEAVGCFLPLVHEVVI